jgi:transposase
MLFFIDLIEKGFTSDDKNKVVAYAGLNPLQQQSGTSLNKTSLSKKGRSNVRKILYMPMMQRYKLITKEKYQNTNLGKFFVRMRTKFES